MSEDWNVERELKKWMQAAIDYADQCKLLNEDVIHWQNRFQEFGNHKFDCAGNDGTVCECGYLQAWQQAFDGSNAVSAYSPSAPPVSPRAGRVE